MTKLLKTINNIPKNYFSLGDLKKLDLLDENSLNVSINRLVKNQRLIRLHRGFYTNDLTKVNFEQLACEIYQPSYLSFEWVLAKHSIISQQPINLTLATIKQSKQLEVGPFVFFYHRLKPELFWEYEPNKNYLEAKPEKAWLDLAYLSLNGYARFNTNEMNLNPLKKPIVKQYLLKFKNKKLNKLVKLFLS